MIERYNLLFLQTFYASAAKEGKCKDFLCRLLHGPVEQTSTVSADRYDSLEMLLSLRVSSSCAHPFLSMQQEAED